MQWFKHMTDMIDDPKVRRLVRKHQALGYAVYSLSLERISKRLSTDSPLPDLEETAEDIADLLNTDTVKVEEVMLTCINLRLFEQSEMSGRIVCNKLYKFIEKSQTRSAELRAMIDKYKESGCMRLSETVSDCPDRREEKRREENRREETKTEYRPHVFLTEDQYKKLIDEWGRDNTEYIIVCISEYVDRTKKEYKNFYLTALKWMKKEEKDGKMKKPVKVVKKICPKCGAQVRDGSCLMCMYVETEK